MPAGATIRALSSLPPPPACELASLHSFPSLPVADERQTLVVVGNGMTSHRLCHELVEHGVLDQLRVVVLGAERHPAYDRVRLTSLLQGGSVEELLLAGPEWYARVGIELHLGEPVEAIDRDECLVRTVLGREVPYDRLVLATGSAPFVPPIPGAHLRGVFVYRTIEDLQAIRRHARGRSRAVVVGGGLLGLEAARAVLDLGLEVTVVEGGATLLQRQLDAAGGRRLAQAVEALGVRVVTGRRTAGIARVRGGLRLALDDGAHVEGDLVILSAGVRPASGLARSSGLALAPDGGVAVDATLMTSDDRIFAVGECASPLGRSVGLVSPGYRMVQVLVANLTGGRVTFRAKVPPTRLKTLGVPVASVGETGEERPDAVTTVYEDGACYRKLVLRRGRLVGALAVGDWSGFDRVAQGVQTGVRVAPWDLRRFRVRGDLWADARDTTPVVEWPDDAVVCTCLGVTRGRIAAAREEGACAAEDVCRATSAGTMCGGCRPLLEQLVEALPPPRRVARAQAMQAVVAAYARELAHPTGVHRAPGGPPRRQTLPPFHAVKPSGKVATAAPASSRAAAVVSALALAITLALVALPALPPPSTALGDRALALLDARAFKLATGFAATGLAAASLLLAARRRLRWFSVGSPAAWRTAHLVLGALAALAVLAHTGGRLGANLNLALVLSFVVVAATGAAAGLLAGRCLGWIHVLALAPLPALLGLHVLAAFYFQ
jgi:nitrite reductase (NADH) large subunit